MKQMETTTKEIGNYTFYLKPFPAFLAANISGELASILLPMVGALVPAVTKMMKDSDTENIMDFDLENLDAGVMVPAMTKAMFGMSGSQVERFMKKLLTDNKNISVDNPETGRTELLTFDLANELFCMDIQDMYLLCYEVIKLNFSGFFKNLGSRFGSQISAAMKAPSMTDTENSI